MSIIDGVKKEVAAEAVTESDLFQLLNLLATASDILSKDPSDRFARCTEAIMEAYSYLHAPER